MSATASVYVVTGGSRGIGKAIVKKLAKDYPTATIVFNYFTREAEATAVAAEVAAEGGKASFIQADVGTPAGVQTLFMHADGFGELRGLVNNAGILGPEGSVALEDLTAEDFQQLFAVNTLGPFLCIQEAVKRMKALAPQPVRGRAAGARGSIVNISSGSAYIGKPLLYGASKAALNSLQIGLVPDLGKVGIRLNTISPGMIATDMVTDEAFAAAAASIPMGRMGEPENIADATAFFLDEEKSVFTSGANLRVSGGRPPGSVIG